MDKAKQQTAKSYVEAGRLAQRSGDYNTAVMLYRKAYELIPHPVLWFDIAQAYRLGGNVDKALRFYRMYLKADPEGPEARTARELVSELEAEQGADTETEVDTEDPSLPSPPDERTARADDETASDAPARDKPDAAQPRSMPPLPNLRIDAGTSIANRQLSYDTRADFMQAPPQSTTTAVALRLEATLYPLALADEDSALAGLGLAAGYDKTLGLTIHSANLLGAPVDQSRGRIGARFRTAADETTSFTFGLDYARRQYVLDRSQVGFIDVPDVDYASIDPVIGLDLRLNGATAIFARADAMLMLDAGPIAGVTNPDRPSFGRSTIFGFETVAGVEVALSGRLQLRVTLEYSRIDLGFETENDQTSGRDGDLSTRDVTGAVDRSFGASATLGLVY